jgi:NADH-quinone oxidoreductase subunit K
MPLACLPNSFGAYHLSVTDAVMANTPPLQAGQVVNWVLFYFMLFMIGLIGMIYKRNNFLVTMMAVELMYLGAISSFVLYGAISGDTRALVFGLLFLILAASESAIGLGILIVLHRFGAAISFKAYERTGG